MLHKTAVPGGQMFSYALAADAPPLSDSSLLSPQQVPLQLLFEDDGGGGGGLVWDSPVLDFGTFTYLDDPAYSSLMLDPGASQVIGAAGRKRKLSPQASPRRSPEKRSSSTAFHGLAAHSLADTTLSLPATAIFSPSPRPSSVAEQYSSHHHHHQQQSRRYSGPDFLQSTNATGGLGLAGLTPPQHYYTSDAGHSTPLAAHSTPLTTQARGSFPWPYYPNAAPAASAIPGTTRSPSSGAAGSSSSRASQLGGALAGPGHQQNPALFRTSTLSIPSAPQASAANSDSAFNPYTMYPAKAQLKLEGDLEAMSKEWSDAEWASGRRLVQFRRSQNGSTITASFAAVAPEDREPASICVSCIWWEAKGECYVTSVDTIALLESLVAVRFTVEEKNRIRRNLEGYRPTTVSKSKPASDDFFRLIMSFPNPKPRNIEKDVKVFPWRILPRALTKIIGKYSASYSTTAGALPITAGSAGPAPLRRLTAGAHAHAQALPSLSTNSPGLSHALLHDQTANAGDPFSPHSLLNATVGLGAHPSEGYHQPDPWPQSQSAYTVPHSSSLSSWTMPGAAVAPLHYGSHQHHQHQNQPQLQQQPQQHRYAMAGSPANAGVHSGPHRGGGGMPYDAQAHTNTHSHSHSPLLLPPPPPPLRNLRGYTTTTTTAGGGGTGSRTYNPLSTSTATTPSTLPLSLSSSSGL